MTDSFSEVRAIFERAIELPAGERDAWLDRECGDRRELRAEVEELLASADTSADLEPVSGGEGLPALVQRLSAPEITGTRVGGYRLGRVLASGGMGVVFEAEQDEPRRSVALKMLRLGLDSAESTRRFRYEAEILAQLRHPGIAQVYETGVHRTGDGSAGDRELPWFAMEFVEGARSIVDFATAEHLSTEKRIRLFLRVCEAVEHGHQRGVIHRDLKPDNILVDATGTPKVIDFGVARATDCDLARASLLTRTGQVVGTLQYMAPEQTEGGRAHASVRTDVYALGLVLFELLTGHHAYDLADKGIHEIAEAIHTAPARRLSSFDPQLTGDLELIVDTAIDKDPERRYASVALLAADLRRFLLREPIAARPPSVTYQLRLFARRHRALVVAVATILLVSVVAAAISVHWALRSEDAHRTAQREKTNATELLGLLLDDSLTSVLEFEQRLAERGETAELRRDLLRQSIDRLVALESRAGDDADVLLPLLRAYLRLGKLEGSPTVRNLGDLDAGRRGIRRAHELATRLAQANPGDLRIQRALGEATASLASLSRAAGDREKAVSLYREAIALMHDAAGDDPLAVDLPLSAAYGHLAVVLTLLQRPDEARAAADARTAVTRRALAAAPADPDRLGNHASSAAHLALMLVQHDDYEPALELLEEAAATQTELLREHGRSIDRYFSIKTRLMQVQPLWKLGRYDEAETVMDEGLGDLAHLAESEPEVENYAFQQGVAHVTFGDLYQERADARAESVTERRDRARARDHYAGAAEVLDRLHEAGKLAPETEGLRQHAHRRLRACEAELAR